MTPPPIPVHAADLDALAGEARRQTEEVRTLFASLDPEARTWRPSPDRWSVAGHIAHMSLVNGPYVEAMAECSRRARSRGRTSDGPYRHPWLASWFARNMEPPPKQRVRTMGAMVPDPDVADPVADFAATQDALVSLFEEARGVDLGRARFASPFFRLLRLSLGTGFHTLLAHNRRHVWLAREVMAAEGFPSASDG
ncbi:MAG: DinB family protein [Longimicrobiales bacterium]